MADKRDILIRLLGEETVSRMAGKAGDGLDKLGDSLDATEKDAKDLDKQIAEVEGSLKTLAVAFARTTDAADRMDISKAMRRQQAKLRTLTKSKDFLPDFGKSGEEAASGFAASFVARLGPLMASAPMGPAGAAAGVALGAAAAPTLAAAISGAVVGAAGVGGVIGGVALAARDPRVKAAGSALGTFILGDLEARASGFVPPVLEGIADIRAGWQDMGPDLDRVFESSRFVDPLVQGAISGGKKFVSGFADAIDKADPAVDAFGRLVDQMGESIGGALSSMADDADEGAAAIDDLTMAVSRFVDTTAAIVHAGAVVKGWTGEVDKAIDRGRFWLEDWVSSGGAMEHFGWQLDLTADGFKAGSKEAEAYRKAAVGTAQAADFATLKTAGMTDAEIAAADASGTYRQQLDEVNNALGDTPAKVEDAIGSLRDWYTALDEMTGKNLDARQAQRDLEEAIDAASEAVKKNGKTAIDHGAALDINSAKGRANAEALDKIAGEANDAYKAILDQTGSQDLANAAAERGRAKFITLAQKMGLSETAAIELADSLIRIKDRRVTVSANTAPALAAAKAIQKRINNMSARINVYAEPSGGFGGGKGTGFGYSTGMSEGGMVTGRGPKGIDTEPRVLAVGEGVLTSGEVDSLGGPAGFDRLRAAIRSGGNPAAGRPSAAGGSGGGGGAQRVEVVLRIDGNDRGIVGALLKGIKDMGGNPAVLGIGGNW